MSKGVGFDLSISKTQIRKAVQTGGSLFSALIPLAKSMGPTIAKTLGLSALGGLAADGVSQLAKKISGGAYDGYLVPNHILSHLVGHRNFLTKKQRENLEKAMHTGSHLAIKPTSNQYGKGIVLFLLLSVCHYF